MQMKMGRGELNQLEEDLALPANPKPAVIDPTQLSSDEAEFLEELEPPVVVARARAAQAQPRVQPTEVAPMQQPVQPPQPRKPFAWLPRQFFIAFALAMTAMLIVGGISLLSWQRDSAIPLVRVPAPAVIAIEGELPAILQGIGQERSIEGTISSSRACGDHVCFMITNTSGSTEVVIPTMDEQLVGYRVALVCRGESPCIAELASLQITG